MFRQTTGKMFYEVLKASQNKNDLVKEFVHLYDKKEYSEMQCFLSTDINSGYCIKNDGDIVSVFSLVKGRGKQIMLDAVTNGGYKLDCFDGYLTKFYSSIGFIEYKSEKNWDKNGPDVKFMRLNRRK